MTVVVLMIMIHLTLDYFVYGTLTVTKVAPRPPKRGHLRTDAAGSAEWRPLKHDSEKPTRSNSSQAPAAGRARRDV